MKLSSGYIKTLSAISFAYGIFATSEELDKGNQQIDTKGLLIREDEYQDTIISYRKGLNDRLYEFMKQHKDYQKPVMTLTEKIFHKVSEILVGKEIDLDLLALYLLDEIINRDKTAKEFKEVIHQEDLQYLFDLVIDGYEKKLSIRFSHRKLAKKILEEIL